jgi:acyl dehydratase
MAKRYLEDFHAGQVFEVGSHTFTRDEIVEFGTRYDPQPFHIDEEAARQTPWGGLIASGWHTIGIVMRLTVECYINDSASLGSPGIDEIRFLKPVRPGDTITARSTVLEVAPSRSKADRGHIITRAEAFNQKGELVLSFVGRGIYFRRPA